MDISINWIKDFVDLPEMDANDLAVKFTMATCEVEEVKKTNEHLSKVVTAKVISVDEHPDSEKLHLVTIDTGTEETEVVCGAPDVNVGNLVPYAPVGTTFPGGFTLVPKKIRGVESCGMLCAETELGLGDNDEKLMEVKTGSVLGTPMSAIYDITVDTLLDIDNKSITHRPDLWGHFGMAREFALVFGAPLKSPFTEEWAKHMRGKCGAGHSPVVPIIEGETSCRGYYGLSVDGIKVEASPKWMQDRLSSCGLRPINNIVDISNYVMLELGMPNHIFDRDSIAAEKIIIRPAGNDTTFVTLDEEERKLLATDTVVADSEKPLVIAGVMGGANSGVTDSTTRIFIESANWTDVEVRKTSTRIGLRTDSSQRYEKCLDSQLLERSLLRILELIVELNPEAKVIGKIEKVGHEATETYIHKTINITTNRICKVLGKQINEDEIIRILNGLEYTVDKSGETLNVTVPSFRATKDVEVDADIIEEIGRIIGYDNIEPIPSMDMIKPIRLSQSKVTHRKLQDFMVYNGGALEIMTNPMIGEKLLTKACWSTKNEELKLVNALSKDHDRMRPSMLPSALEAASLNSKNFANFANYEIGRSYLPSKKEFSQEANTLVITLFDKKESRFMELTNLVERLIKQLNLPAQIVPVNSKFPSMIIDRGWDGLHPNEQLDIKIMGRNLGVIATLHPTVAREFKIKGNMAFALVDLSAFEDKKQKEKVNYKPLPKFPSSTFDCTVILEDKKQIAEAVTVVAKKLKLKHLLSAKVADVFELENGKRAVTLRTTFLDEKETMKSEFLDESQKKIIDGLEREGFPLKV
jgi:phenylalanyl-tRNA synthetase beta chain